LRLPRTAEWELRACLPWSSKAASPARLVTDTLRSRI